VTEGGEGGGVAGAALVQRSRLDATEKKRDPRDLRDMVAVMFMRMNEVEMRLSEFKNEILKKINNNKNNNLCFGINKKKIFSLDEHHNSQNPQI
jgi:hypothetical protein